MRLALLSAACGLLALAAGAREDFAPCSGVIESDGNLSFPVRWNPGSGLHLRVASADSNRVVELSFRRQNFAIRVAPDEGSGARLAEARQYKPGGLPEEAATNLPVVLKFRQENWSLYADGRFVATLPPALEPPFVVSQPPSQQPAGARNRFQKVADFRFEDSFLRPEGDENLLGEWTPESGSWYLHTALETALANNMVKPESKRLLKSDFSPNFYSLAGKGTGAVITVGYDFYDLFTYEAGVRTGPGERGLLFARQKSGACYGFTLAMDGDEDAVLAALWSAPGSNLAERATLASVSLKAGPGQWMKLRVKLLQNRIVCFLDQEPLFDVQADLPPGGLLGLYADTTAEARFDDVTAETTHDLDFRDIHDLRRYTLAENGAFFPRSGWRNWFAKPEQENLLAPSVSKSAQWLAVGAAAHAPHVFAADFETPEPDATVGLLAGYTAPGKPHFRFVCRRIAAGERFTLERVEGARVEILEDLRVPAAPGAAPAPRLRLLFDASVPGEWRLYRNEELVLVRARAEGGAGASGLYVGPGTRTRIGVPLYQFRREGLFLNRYEKNNRYVDDPFMRHWASPEGQWLEETNRLTWYTGDFFGRFSLRMPYVEASEIHLGVGEGETNGEWVVQAVTNTLVLRRGAADPAAAPAAVASAKGLAMDDATNASYKVQSEGRWLWATSGDRLLFKQSLAAPLKGRRIRVAGYTTQQLRPTYVERYNVKDFLFTESLFDWVINGGRWEIVNRFQCDPRWSHMNGEGTNGLAALWAKYEIGGDFCVEMHAGQRHGWYERCGDLNFSVMSPDTTLSRGYTLTCTGWDPDQSQLFTTLYRDGKVLAKSDKYLVPRKREGNRRLGYEPLVATGRDVHGAWYYLKLRRIGKTIEFFFDNELVFSVRDEEPLQDGLAGIWTFMNSIMVARVKVAAERIRPRPVPVLAAPAPAPAAAAPVVPVERGGLRKDGKPLALCQPSLWEADDPVSRLRLEWPETGAAGESGEGNWFVARNVMGGGSMAVSCALPPVPLEKAAGWRFEILRSPGAQFNFHFSVGRLNEAGLFVTEQRFVHRLSGPDPAKSEWILAGSTPVKPAAPVSSGTAAAHRDSSDRDGWQPVTVWVPGEWPARQPGVPYLVRVEGFGVLQPAYEMAGLTGNGPGELYGVKDFTEIGYGEPRLALPVLSAIPSVFSVLEADTGRPVSSFTSLTGLQAWAAAPGTTGLIRVVVDTARPRAGAPAPLAWVRLPAQPRVDCVWHPGKPEAVALRCREAYPDPRLHAALVTVQGVPLPVEKEDAFTRVAWIPRQELFRTSVLEVAWSGPVTGSCALAFKDNPTPGRPVLVKLDGVTPFLQNGEPRALATVAVPVNPTGIRLDPVDPRQGTYLRVRNTLHGRRLRCQFPVSLSLARYPIFQFRYRTDDPMVRVSLSFGGGRLARISEPSQAAAWVRGSTNLVFDGAWNTWRGQVSDALTQSDFNSGAFRVANPEIASFHSIDQTGLYSGWDLDDLVFGPAVSKAEQLAFTPEFFDFGGVESVAYALRAGPESFDELAPAQAAAVAWRPVTNGAPVLPRLDGLPDGLCHLFLKARGRGGRDSQVADIPFLLDRVPLTGSHAFGSPDVNSRRGAVLNLIFETGGASPLDVENLKLKWQETEATGMVKGVTLAHQPDRDTLSFTWPQVFRQELARTANGQKVTMILSGLRDGAGNASPDFTIPLVIDHAKDRIPPVLVSVRYPTNVGWHATWEGELERNTQFVNRGAGLIEFTRTTNDPPYLLVKSGTDATIYARFERGWDVKAFPYLAFRVRRPVPASNDTATLTLNVELMSGQNLVVPLTARRMSPRYSPLSEPLKWRSNEWASAFLDLHGAIRDKNFTNTLEAVVKSLSIRASGTDPQATFQVQSFFAYAPGKAADQPTFDAFDSSGMETPVTEWESADGALVAPAFFGGASSSNSFPRGWMVLRPRDRAGNRGLPIRVPAWGPFP